MSLRQELQEINIEDLNKINSMIKEIDDMTEVYSVNGLQSLTHIEPLQSGDTIVLKSIYGEDSPFNNDIYIYTLKFLINDKEEHISRIKYRKRYMKDEETFRNQLNNLVGRYYRLDRYMNFVRDDIDRDNSAKIKDFVSKTFTNTINRYYYFNHNTEIDGITAVYENSFAITYLKDDMKFKVIIDECESNYITLKTEFIFKYDDKHIVSYYTKNLERNFQDNYKNIIEDIITSIAIKVRRM